MQFRIERQTIDTAALHIAYETSGPLNGVPLFLLHGWPDSVRTWDRTIGAFHDAGYRTIVPDLRGCGSTRFRDAAIARSGQLAALGADVLDLADALGIERFAIIGHDWGARAAYIASCLRPDRISHCVALSVGWGTNDPAQSLTLRQIQNYWYHWYMSLERGADLVRRDRRALTRHIWSIWNPNWTISEAEFDETAVAFDNPDWADVVVHSYRHRWGLAASDPRYDTIEAQLRSAPEIDVPTLVIHGGSDPCNDPSTSDGKEHFFRARYERVVLTGIGHFPQREAPGSVARASLTFLADGMVS